LIITVFNEKWNQDRLRSFQGCAGTLGVAAFTLVKKRTPVRSNPVTETSVTELLVESS